MSEVIWKQTKVLCSEINLKNILFEYFRFLFQFIKGEELSINHAKVN
jgi:hypothetical protein